MDFSFWVNITTILLVIGSSLILYFQYCYTYWARRKIPYITPTIPFGNGAPQILQTSTIGENNMHHYQHLKSLGYRYGGIYIFTKPILLILDPNLAKDILCRDFQYFHDRGFYYDEENEPLTAHLLSLAGTKWRNLRTKFTPTFTASKIKLMFSILVQCSEHLEDVLQQEKTHGNVIDIKDITGRFTTDVIGSCAFGLECNSLKNPDVEFRKYSKMIFEPTTLQSFKTFFSILYPKLFLRLKLKKLNHQVSSFFLNLVNTIVKYREETQEKRMDFMQLMINLKSEDELVPGKKLTVEDIAAQTFLFFLAGYETSSTTMSFFLYDMALNPDIQDRIRDEMNQMLKRYNGVLTYDGVLELTYLDNAIHESLRLHPPIPFLQRNCTKKYQIPETDVTIEVDTPVIIPILGFQSDPEYYPDPLKFNPDRFSSEEKHKRNPYTFLPFGEGPRVCLGSRFGLLQAKVGLIAIMKNHRISISPKTRQPIKFDPKCFVLTVTGGLWLSAEVDT